LNKTSDDNNIENKPKKNKVDQNTDSSYKNAWFVVFYTIWAETCMYTRPNWDEYSSKYNCDALHFAEVNIGKDDLKELAQKYYISTSGVSRQLPTLILFENGEEVLRFPPLDEKGKVAKV